MAKSETLSEQLEVCGKHAVRFWADRGCDICKLEDKAFAAGRLQGLEEAGKVRAVLLEALESCLGSLQMESECYGECGTDPCTQCRAKLAIKLAVVEAIREKADG